MKKILVPVDFSSFAGYALKTAIQIGSRTGAHIQVLHVCRIKVPTAYISLSQIRKYEEKAVSDAKLLMESFIANVKAALSPELLEKVTLSSDVILGVAIEEIIRTVEANSYNLIVMGTKGASGLKEVLIGSHTSAVMEFCHVPVLAIPSEQPYKALDHIVFASNLHPVWDQVMESALAFVRLYHAKLSIIYVDTRHEAQINEKSQHLMSQVNRLLGEGYDVKFEKLTGTSVTDKIHEYVRNNQVDMLIMTREQHSNFERIFASSMTQTMAHHATVPLLIIHSEN